MKQEIKEESRFSKGDLTPTKNGSSKKKGEEVVSIDFKSENGQRYLGGEHYVDFVLSSELCLPAQKIEAVMWQSLSDKPPHVGKSVQLSRRRKASIMKQNLIKIEDTAAPVTQIDVEARKLVQVAVTEFICFITSDMIDEITKQNRVAIKEQDIIESLENMGFSHYLPILDTQMRKLAQIESTDGYAEQYTQMQLKT